MTLRQGAGDGDGISRLEETGLGFKRRRNLNPNPVFDEAVYSILIFRSRLMLTVS